MEHIFLQVLNMSATASYVIAAVLLLRLLLRKLPKKIPYLLWSVVAFRLCCPVTWQSVFSLFSLNPLADSVRVTGGGATRLEYFPSNAGTAAPPQINGGTLIPPVGEAVSNTLPAATPVSAVSAADPLRLWITIGTVIWCVGMAALLVYSMICYGKMRRRMSTAVLFRGNVYQSDCIRSPFILGLVRPKIYIPFGLDQDTMKYVLAHERYHIRRRDYLIKPFAFLLLTIHWFNPLCWLAFHLMGKDMEMSCDEKVLTGEGSSVKAYSASLLSFAVSRRFPSPSPLAFGETSVKSRIKNVLRWRKPKTWVTLLAVLLCVLVIVACAANPAQSADPKADGTQTGQYADMEEFAEQTMAAAQGTYYSISLGSQTTADILETKLEQLEKTGQVSGLAPEGTLESWRFRYLVKIDADPDDVFTMDGPFEDGWYDLEGQGGHNVVALRYEDGSYDILYDEPVNDGQDFYGYHHSYEEAIYDWYVTEYGLDLPLYVIDLLPYDELGNHPARRYDGDGWYIYILLSQWEEAEASADHRMWVSAYNTGSYLSVDRLDSVSDLPDTMTVVDASKQLLEDHSNGISTFYYFYDDYSFYNDPDGCCWRVTIQWVDANIIDHPYISMEPDVLKVMAESFTVDRRFLKETQDEYDADGDYAEAGIVEGMVTALASVGEDDAVTLTRDAVAGPDGADNAALQTTVSGTSNSRNYFNGLQDLAWTGAAAQEEPVARNVTLSTATGWSLRVYEDCDAARLVCPEGEYWLAVSGYDVFSHPYQLLRGWYDEAEYLALNGSDVGGDIVIPDQGQSDQEIVQAWVDAYEGRSLNASRGSKYCYTYVKNNVTVETNLPPALLQPWEDTTAFGFSYETIFVPENERAWQWSMAGNTGPYSGNDPSVPDGAYLYSRRGILYLAEDGWHCDGVGTGW